jgi:CheY-like chemotaxis protein
MDMKMPVMNGYEATEQIKSRALTSSPAIVALTASTSEEERSLFRESGCDDFVGKPFAENIIFDKIAQHLGVRYVYQITVPPTKKQFKLTGDRLQVMSEQWIEQIEQAAVSLDTELLTVLFGQIPPEHSDLSDALQKLVDNFDFEKILRAIEQSKSKSSN